jgi:hypothetical protein
MSLNKKKIAEEELRRALLMMKYDNRKTLSENTNDLILEQTNCPNTYDASIIKQKAFDLRDIIELIDTTLLRTINVDGRCKEIYDIIKDLSQHNFYNDLEKTCENSLKRLKEEYLTTGNVFFNNNSIEEQIQEILDDYVGSTSVGAANYLKSALKLIAENENKLAGGTDKEDSSDIKQENIKQYTEVEQRAIACGYVTPNGGPDVTAYKEGDGKEEFKCPKVGAKGCKHCPKKQGGGQGGTGTYRACTGTYTQGCKSEAIRKVQGCLGGLTADGKFGPKTQSALEAKGLTNGFTDKDVDKICNTVQTAPEPEPIELPIADDNIDSINN